MLRNAQNADKSGHPDIRAGRGSCQKALDAYKPQLARYTGLVQQIKDKSKERKALLAEKKALPARKIFKHKELASRIAELTEDLEELRSEKALLLKQLDYAEDAGAETFRKDISALEASLQNPKAKRWQVFSFIRLAAMRKVHWVD